jgi:hypothetical protein
MKVLSVRQPYAWLIAVGLKPIENRAWRTHHRGRLLIHAAREMHADSITAIENKHGIKIDPGALQFAGVIGCVEIVNIVTQSPSPWFCGPVGWVLVSTTALHPIHPLRGMPGLFDFPDIDDNDLQSSLAAADH